MFLNESGILYHIAGPVYLKDCLFKFNRQRFGKTFKPFLVCLVGDRIPFQNVLIKNMSEYAR